MFKNPRDQQQVAVLARQIHVYPNRPQNCMPIYMAEYYKVTRNPCGYLFVDLKQDTPDDQRLKTDLFEPPCDQLVILHILLPIKAHGTHPRNITLYLMLPIISNAYGTHQRRHRLLIVMPWTLMMIVWKPTT